MVPFIRIIYKLYIYIYTHTHTHTYIYIYIYIYIVDRVNSFGIATRYWLEGPGIESRWGARFSAPVHTGPWAHPASYVMGTGCFPGSGIDHPPPSSTEVEKRVDLCIYSYFPSGASWPLNLPLSSYVAYVSTQAPTSSFRPVVRFCIDKFVSAIWGIRSG
jgi:hypothetical protein